jgi:hypothetical protein
LGPFPLKNFLYVLVWFVSLLVSLHSTARPIGTPFWTEVSSSMQSSFHSVISRQSLCQPLTGCPSIPKLLAILSPHSNWKLADFSFSVQQRRALYRMYDRRTHPLTVQNPLDNSTLSSVHLERFREDTTCSALAT